jgi:hypothetical protein
MPILLYIAMWSCAFGMASCLGGSPGMGESAPAQVKRNRDQLND